MSRLKPCPWCPSGGQPQTATIEALHSHVCCVECIECGSAGPTRETEAEAVAAWDQRSHLESVPSPGSDPVEAFNRLAELCRPLPPPAEAPEGGG